MRTPFVAGNWKMNKTLAEARVLVAEMVPALRPIKGVEKVLCPPYMALVSIAALLEGTDIGLGAQDLYWQPKGAYTGEVSPGMIAEFCQYVIIGHSERRTYFGETDLLVHRKAIAALAAGLKPIVCVGETLTEYEAGQTAEVVSWQVYADLHGLPQESLHKAVVAYEPIWAIGTGRASTGENAERVIRDFIRKPLASMFGEEVAQEIRVLYGGSVIGENAAEFFSQPDIDGALVGGASLKAQEFIKITQLAKK